MRGTFIIRLLQTVTFAALIQFAAPLLLFAQFSTPPLLAAGTVAPSQALSTPDVAELSAAEQQIELLEAQLRITRNYQGSLLDTVYWALGGIFIVVSLLLGFGWFVNFKVYERDKDSLRAEFEVTARAKATELERSIAKQISVVSGDIPRQIDNSIAESLRSHTASVAAIDRRIFQVELRHLKNKMETNTSDNMALTDALSLLELCHKKAQDEIPDIIHFMLKKLDKGRKLTAREITRVNAVLDSLPLHYQALTDKLRTKLIASDIF